MSEKAVDRASVLSAYSAGKIGWREACKGLVLMDLDELHAALEEEGLPPPEEVDEPEVSRRFVDMVKKKD